MVKPKEKFDSTNGTLTPDSTTKNPMPKTDQQKLQCSHCSSMFAYKSLLEIHVRRIRLGIQRPFKCQYCKKSFHLKVNMEVHIKTIHKKLKAFMCERCGKVFAQKKNIKMHLRKHQKSNVEYSPEFFEQNHTSEFFSKPENDAVGKRSVIDTEIKISGRDEKESKVRKSERKKIAKKIND